MGLWALALLLCGAALACDDTNAGSAQENEPDTMDAGDSSDTNSPLDTQDEDSGEEDAQDIADDTLDDGLDAAQEDAVEDADPADTEGMDADEDEPQDPLSVCGDGVPQGDEACDDGNTDDNDYCSADCTAITGSCGDGIPQNNEACDDGNTDGGDYCSPDCGAVTGSCGDGTPQANEACDDGNTNDNDYCSADCTAISGRCGDATVQGNESCDDGVTDDCQNTHNGGDGDCVAQGTCSPGFVLDGQGQCVGNPTGLSTPCSNGEGWTVWRFHYDDGSTSARIDVWDASCEYSFAPNSACNVRDVYPGFGEVDRTREGFPIVTTREYLRIRFSVAGLRFSQASLHVKARSINGSSSFRAWSPLYGEVFGGPVDGDFVYDWYAVDWSNFLSPTDSPSLTAVQLYAAQSSGRMAIESMELCVQ